jgi:hypothetical protein
VASCYECGDEPSSSCATELVSFTGELPKPPVSSIPRAWGAVNFDFCLKQSILVN